MRRLVLGLFLILTLTSCAEVHPMAGQWKGIDADGKEVILFLDQDGKFEAVAKGERVQGTWAVNDQVEPMRFVLNFEGKKVASIAKIQKDHLLIEPVGPDGKLPSSFSENATYYKRQ